MGGTDLILIHLKITWKKKGRDFCGHAWNSNLLKEACTTAHTGVLGFELSFPSDEVFPSQSFPHFIGSCCLFPKLAKARPGRHCRSGILLGWAGLGLECSSLGFLGLDYWLIPLISSAPQWHLSMHHKLKQVTVPSAGDGQLSSPWYTELLKSSWSNTRPRRCLGVFPYRET